MFPTSFPESNHALDRPPDMEECDALSVWVGQDQNKQPIVISCWKFTPEELETILKTGRVWLYVYGHTMPPVALSGLSPFTQQG